MNKINSNGISKIRVRKRIVEEIKILTNNLDESGIDLLIKYLNPSTMLIIFILQTNKRVHNLSIFCEKIGMDYSIMTGYFDVFVRLGLLRKEKISRTVTFYLTAKGQKIIQGITDYLK